MIVIRKIYFFIIITLLVIPFNTVAYNNLNITVTTPIIHSLLKLIVNESTNITTIIKNNSPHDYQLKLSDIKNINHSNLVFYVDNNLETFMKKINNTNCIQLSQYLITLKDTTENNNLINKYDPHVWLSPYNAKIILTIMCNKLTEVDKENASLYKHNLQLSLKKIDDLIQNIKQQLQPLQKQEYIVIHNAYQYFTTAFNLPLPKGILMSNHDNVTLKNIYDIEEIIIKNNIQCIISDIHNQKYNSIFTNKKINIITLDPEGSNITYINKDTYLNFMKELTNKFLLCFNQ